LLTGVQSDLAAKARLSRARPRLTGPPSCLPRRGAVSGGGCFRASVWKGVAVMEGVRGHLSGLGVPTYVVDAPHGGGKIPLMPNYLVSMSDDVVVLRNYEGLLVRYQAEDKPSAATAPPARTQGVSLLLQGGQTALIPPGNERMARRRGGRAEQNTCGGEGAGG